MSDAASSGDPIELRAGSSDDDEFARPSALACASAVLIFGTLSTLLIPALLQGWGDQHHWSGSRLGWLASVEMGGTALGALSAFFWQRRWNWRRVSGCAIMLIVGANLANLGTSDFTTLTVLRFWSGAAGGVLVGIYTAYLANTRSPEKFLAATTFAQILVQGALMSLSSALLARFGMPGIYAMLSICVAILLPFLRCLPAGWPKAPEEVEGPTDTVAPRSRYFGLFILAAFIPFFAFEGGTFAFLHQFGERGAGLSPSHTLHLIGLSALGSGAGPIAAYFLAERAGVMLPLAASILVMAATMTGLAIGGYSAPLLLFYLCLLQAAWLFAICYLYAALIKADNLLTQAGSPLSAVFLAVGASLMGVTVERSGLNGILLVALICLASTAVLTLPLLYVGERRRTKPAALAGGPLE